MKDFMKNDLYLGDEVVFMSTEYNGLKNGYICKIGESKITIRSGERKFNRFPDKTCKI